MRYAIISVLAFLVASNVFADDADDASAKLYEYFETFNQKDITKIAGEIYSTPLHIGGGDGHRVLESPDAATANLSNLYEQIEAQG